MTPAVPLLALRGLRGLAALAGAALLLAAALVVGAGAGGPHGWGAARAAAADPTDVFVGVVDRARTSAGGAGSAGAGSGAVSGSGASRTVTYDVTVLSVYLGDVRTEEVEVTSTPAFFACPTRRVTQGQQYAFRVVSRGEALVASTCRDVRPATASVRTALAATYPDVRPPVSPGVSFDEVAYRAQDLGEPVEFTRAAAPGAALVLVGLLGLLVARRFARSRA